MIPAALRAVRRRVRSSWADVGHRTGALDRRLGAALQTSAVVLTYHRVLTDDERDRSWSHPGMVVSVDTFARHVKALRNHFAVVGLAEFTASVTDRRPLPPRACLITFDDGWLDTWQRAAPILAEHRVPATVFLTSRFMGRGEGFWQERLCRALDAAVRSGEARCTDARARLAPFGIDAVLAGVPDRSRLFAAAQQLKRAEHGAVLDLVDALEALVGSTTAIDQPDRFMSWAQAGELAAGGFTVGAHGSTHRLLGSLPAAEVAADVEESRTTIVANLGHCQPAFCYPNGSWSATALAAVESAGFRLAFTTDEGFVDAHVEPFRVPRVNMHDDMTYSVPVWISRILGVKAR